jgi:pyruvate dehydrogenase E2 component (dihydrolipoamide acetyltransferase)
VETDKADMDLEVFSSGILTKILYKEGYTVPVGTVIAVLGGEETAEVPKKVGEPFLSEKKVTKPSQPPEQKVETGPGEPFSTFQLEDEEEVEKEVPLPAGREEKPKISPSARRLVEEKRIGKMEIKGSGPGGRIVKEDVERLLRERVEQKKNQEFLCIQRRQPRQEFQKKR